MSNTTTAKGTESKVESIIPILYVKNLAASIAYYVNVLGFKKDWDWGDPPAFGSVSRDDFSIMLSEGWGGTPEPGSGLASKMPKHFMTNTKRAVRRFEKRQRTIRGHTS